MSPTSLTLAPFGIVTTTRPEPSPWNGWNRAKRSQSTTRPARAPKTRRGCRRRAARRPEPACGGRGPRGAASGRDLAAGGGSGGPGGSSSQKSSSAGRGGTGGSGGGGDGGADCTLSRFFASFWSRPAVRAFRFSSRSRRRCSRSAARGSSGSAKGSPGRRSSAILPSFGPGVGGEVGLEQVGGGERVGRRGRARAAALLRHPGGQALVVGLDRDVEQRLEFPAERADEAGLTALFAAEVEGQPDDDALDAMLGDELGDGARLRRFDRRQRRCQSAARVGERAADP